MEKAPDFLLDKDDSGIDSLDMNTLQGMIESYDEYTNEVERAEKWLKSCKEQFNRISLEAIPQFMLSHGMTSMKLTDGREVVVKEDISATVKDELAFRDWLKSRSEEDIIKVKYNMARMSPAMATALSDYLAKYDYDYEIDESIHAQTKKKYFKELIKEIGQEALPEWVGIYNIRKAKVK
jgi:hypothetical protein